MDFNEASGEFVLTRKEQAVLGLPEGVETWPVDNPEGLLAAIDTAQSRIDATDPSEHPNGALRAGIQAGRSNTEATLRGVRAVLAPHLRLSDDDFDALRG
jgi:hypothetical protein